MSEPDPPGTPGNPFPVDPDTLRRMLTEMLAMAAPSGGFDPRLVGALAAQVATEGTPEPNVDPLERMRFEQLSRVAQLHLEDLLGVTLGPLDLRPVNRSGWAVESVTDFATWLAPLAVKLHALVAEADLSEEDLPEDLDPSMRALFAMMTRHLGPLLNVSLVAGTVGQLGARSLGQYDVPLPRRGDSLLLNVPNIDAFAADWELPGDELRLWICVREISHHWVLSQPVVRDRLGSLLSAHTAAFPDTLDPRVIAELFDPDEGAAPSEVDLMPGLTMVDPEGLLRALETPRQRELRLLIDTVVAIVVGWSDWVTDRVSERLMPGATRMAEALRRRRVERDAAARFCERLFGLTLSPAVSDAGSSFVRGVVDRAGPDVLAELFSDEAGLPTPTELAAPGLWLARRGHETPLSEDGLTFTVPDFPDFDE